MRSVERLVAETNDLLGVNIQFKYDGEVRISDVSTAFHFHQIIRELINNAVKHGTKAGSSLRIHGDARCATIEIRNRIAKGSGAKKEGHGIGLNIIRHRANLIGARLEIFSMADEFRVELTIRSKPG